VTDSHKGGEAARRLGPQPREPFDRHSQVFDCVKLWDFRGQVHRGQDLLGDVLALDEGDEAERGLALRTENLDPEGSLFILHLSQWM